jgi:hypothetical protein
MFELNEPASVSIEGLRDPIYLRGWPLGKLTQMYQHIEKISDPATQEAAVRSILAGSLCTPTGGELTPEDILRLDAVPLPVAMRIAQEVLRANGLSPGSVETAKKNSNDQNNEPSTN